MTKIGRRSFLLGAASALAITVAAPALARNGLPQQMSMNLDGASDNMFMNVCKGAGSVQAGTTLWPGLIDADGYPTSGYGGAATAINGNFVSFSTYYGHWSFQFSGQGAFEHSSGLGYIVYNGGANVGLGSNTGYVGFNLTLSGTNPSCEFAIGALITAVANNGSGNPRLTTSTSILNNFGTSATVQLNNFNGITSGLYVATKVDNQHVDLLAVTYNAGMSVNGGGPGTESEMIAALGSVAWSFPTTNTYGSGATQMSALICCRKGDIDGTNAFGLQNGYQINADLIAQIAAIKPKFIRFLGMSAVIANVETNWTYRKQLTDFSYSRDFFTSNYWGGAAVWASGDNYTCSNPTASPASGAYQDGEIAQLQWSAASVGIAPVLQLGSRGFAPVLANGAMQWTAALTGSVPSVGSTISITFTASYFSGGAHTFNYVTISSDTTLAAITGHLITALNADVTLTGTPCNFLFGGITGNSAAINGEFNNNAGAISYSASPPAGLTVSFGTQGTTGALALNGNATVMYSALLGGFVLSPTNGLGDVAPVEVMCEVCSRSGAALWDQIPLFYSGASAASRGAKVASLLPQAGGELSNEVWNTAQNSTAQAFACGSALGFTGNIFARAYSFHGLRFQQLIGQQMMTAGWIAAGNSRATFSMLMMNWLLEGNGGGSGLMVSQHWQGTQLVTSNATYANFGGLGATPTSNSYNIIPNRVADWMDFIGYAPYPFGVQVADMASAWTGSQTPYNTLLQASANYATGTPALMEAALVAWDQDIATNPSTSSGFAGLPTQYAGFETKVSAYDSEASPNRGNQGKVGVACYEMALQEALGSNFNGTNDTGNDTTGYAPMATQLANLVSGSGWNVSAYGASTTVVAQNLVILFLAYLNSVYYKNRMIAFYQQIVVAHAGRVAYPTQFGYAGPSIWTVFPGNIYGTAYQNQAAQKVWNNH